MPNKNNKTFIFDEYNLKTKTKGKWFDLVLANMLALAFTALGFFTPLLSFALAFIVMSYMQIAVYYYVLNSYREIEVDFSNIFPPFKSVLKILCIKIIALSGMFLWGLLLIVPGVIYGLNCAYAGLIFIDDPKLTIKQIFAKSKELVVGKRIMILLVALIGLIIMCAAASIGVGINFLFNLAFAVPTALTAVLIILPTLIAFITASAPLFQFYLVATYDQTQNKSLIQKKSKNVSKSKKDVI